MARASRQLKILEIISKYDIDTQEELVARLRDDGRHYKYVAQQPKEPTTADKFIKIFRNTVISIRSAENLIILKTEQGSASAAAELIDRLEYEEILGVIAGDNTIFVAVDSVDHVDRIVDNLENILQ